MLTHPQMLTKKLWKTDIREMERKIKVKQEDTGDEPVLKSSGDSKIQPNQVTVTSAEASRTRTCCK